MSAPTRPETIVCEPPKRNYKPPCEHVPSRGSEHPCGGFIRSCIKCGLNEYEWEPRDS